jgi:STE24 endopeptidase
MAAILRDLALLVPASRDDGRRIFLLGAFLFYAVEQLLRYRKHLAFRQGIPPAFRGKVTPEKYTETVDYNKSKNQFGALSDAYSLFLLLVQVHYLWPLCWDSALAYAPEDTAWFSAATVLRPTLFVVLDMLISTCLTEPMTLYATFIVEEKFVKHTAATYISDKLKGLALNLVITLVMMIGLTRITEWAGPGAWVYLWAFISAFVFVLNVAYPVYIAPLFNTFTPLEEGTELRGAIDALVEKSGIDCRQCFMVDGSRQSAHSNAYVAGMCGSRRIVIYDTLVKDFDSDLERVSAVIGHEIGHAKMNHNWALLGATMLQFGIMFGTFGHFQGNAAIVTSFGFRGGASTFLELNCFMAVFQSTVFPLCTVAMNAMVRQLEFAADRYSVELGFDIRPALFDLSKSNLGDLNPDSWHSAYHHNHPPLLERLNAVSDLLGPMPEVTSVTKKDE